MIDQQLLQLIDSDDSGLLDIEIPSKPITADDRLIAGFLEINNFYTENATEPVIGKDIHQMKLAMRLQNLREDMKKRMYLQDYDEYSLLGEKEQNIEIDPIKKLLESDDMGLLELGDTSIFQMKNVPKYEERKEAEFVARRQPCKDFGLFEKLFIEIQDKLKS